MTKPYDPRYHTSLVSNIRYCWKLCKFNSELTLTDQEIYNCLQEALWLEWEDYIEDFPQLTGGLSLEASYAPILYLIREKLEKQND